MENIVPVLVVGDKGCGKNSLASQYCYGFLPDPTFPSFPLFTEKHYRKRVTIARESYELEISLEDVIMDNQNPTEKHPVVPLNEDRTKKSKLIYLVYSIDNMGSFTDLHTVVKEVFKIKQVVSPIVRRGSNSSESPPEQQNRDGRKSADTSPEQPHPKLLEERRNTLPVLPSPFARPINNNSNNINNSNNTNNSNNNNNNNNSNQSIPGAPVPWEEHKLSIVLVGNKTDLGDLKGKRVVTQEMGENFAKRIGAMFLETSVFDLPSVHSMFQKGISWYLETASRAQSIRVLRRTSSLSHVQGGSPTSDPLISHRLTLSPDVMLKETKVKEAAPVFTKIAFKKTQEDTEESKKKKKLEKAQKKKAKKELKKRQELLRQQMLKYEQKFSLIRNLPDAEKRYLDFRPNGGRPPESSYSRDLKNFFLSQRQAQESGTTEHCACIQVSDMQIVLYTMCPKSPQPFLSLAASGSATLINSPLNKNLALHTTTNIAASRKKSVIYTHTSIIQTHFPAIFEVLEVKSKQVSVSPKTDSAIRKVKYRLELDYDSEIEDFWRMMEYIYSGEIDPGWNHQTLYRTLKIAEKFQHYHLSRLCDELITSQGEIEDKQKPIYESAWSLLRQGPPEAILYDTDIFSDVKFVNKSTRELICYSHKVILAARNIYFRQLFSSDPNLAEIEVEMVEGVSSILSFKFLIRYLYTDKYEGIENVVVELYYLALFYQVSRLIILCELAMVEGIDEDNVVDLMVWSEANGVENVYKATEYYCVYHLDWVKNSEGWQERLADDKKKMMIEKRAKLKL